MKRASVFLLINLLLICFYSALVKHNEWFKDSQNTRRLPENFKCFFIFSSMTTVSSSCGFSISELQPLSFCAVLLYSRAVTGYACSKTHSRPSCTLMGPCWGSSSRACFPGSAHHFTWSCSSYPPPNLFVIHIVFADISFAFNNCRMDCDILCRCVCPQSSKNVHDFVIS